jgi:hypothetical protein
MLTTQPTQTTQATQLTKATYEISLVNTGGFVQARNAPPEMKIGETVHFTSADGGIRIVLPNGSPFLDASGSELTEITGPKVVGSDLLPAQIERAAAFEMLCYITLDSVREIGYDPNSPVPGVNIKVGH